MWWKWTLQQVAGTSATAPALQAALNVLVSAGRMAEHGVPTRPGVCAGKWTVQQAAELSVAAPTIEAALDGRFLSGLKEERVEAAEIFAGLGAKAPSVVSVRRIWRLAQFLHFVS